MATQWFDPQPSQEELEFWLGNPFSGDFVSRWPTPDTDRTRSMFRWRYTKDFDSHPIKGIVNVRLLQPNNPNDPEYNVWAPVDYTFPVNPQTLFFEVADGAIPLTFSAVTSPEDVGTLSGQNCVESLFILTLQTPPFFSIDFLYEWTFNGPRPFRYNINTAAYPPDFTFSNPSSIPYAVREFDLYAVADCFSFPRIVQQLAAVFNDFDAWIDFPNDLPYQTGAFQTVFEIMPTADEQMVIGGLKRFGSNFWGFDNLSGMRWWNQPFVMTQPLQIGVWQTVRIERDWTLPGAFRYAVFINDVLTLDTTGSGTISPWDEMGRRGTTFEGAFSVRNLKQYSGSVGAPVLTIDLPLTENACNLADPTLSGTTFNMDLPSCP